MDLEKQAEEMAEKALVSLPPAARAAKLETVKAGILKRLQATQAASPPPPPAVAPPPPPEPDPSDDATSITSIPLSLPGVELFGDLPWFAEPKLRRRLLQEVRQAHAAEKILVGAPAGEIQRILSRKGGQLLAAGAVLRLGGVHHGGYGESDIGYAYRQLSRALHPDKNPGIPEAHDSFKRLGEAAEELKQVLAESRLALNKISQVVLGENAAAESLERPQGELMAEASRLLAAVLAVSGEGTISETALWRAPRIFVLQTGLWRCQPQDLLTKWYQEPQLLELFASSALRIAYDCAKKPFRAQFLCALSRAAEAEARRNDSCVRGSWQKVLTNFPELSLWKALQDKIRSRVWASGASAAGKRSRTSKWDDKSAASSTTDWGKKWRAVVKAVLPKDGNGGVTCSDLEVQKLCLAMWKDLTSWAAEECRQHLVLFQSDEQGDSEETEWAFVPAADLLLLVGEGLVGCAAEGFAAQADEGHTRISFVDALKNWRSSLRKTRGAGQETSDSAVKLWQAGAKREAQKNEKGKEGKEGCEGAVTGNGNDTEEGRAAKKMRTCTEPEPEEEMTKLNRSPTKVLLLTNLVPSSLEEGEIESIAVELVQEFGKIQQCKVLKVPNIPEEEAVRVFLHFDSVRASSTAYAALKGQVREGRALRARFYDEQRFHDGDLQKSVPNRIVLLSGLVTLDELDGGLKERKDEVLNLAEKVCGRVLKCVIQKTELPGDEAVRVLLDFETVDDAVKAVSQLHGQEFGLRRIRARYSNEQMLKPEAKKVQDTKEAESKETEEVAEGVARVAAEV